MTYSERQKKVAEVVNGYLDEVEREIQHWFVDKYRKNIKVSIQLMYVGQGEQRPKPCNNLCKRACKDSNLKAKCDLSDETMKKLLLKQIREERSDSAIGYKCHYGLSNIIIPYYDTKIAKQYWHIFIGQFFLKPCLKGNTKVLPSCEDQMCIAGFQSENIRILRDEEIPHEYKDCIRATFFCNESDINENTYKDVAFLSIPEMLICRLIAVDRFSNFLEKVHSNKKKTSEIMNWCKMHYAYKTIGTVAAKASIGYRTSKVK